MDPLCGTPCGSAAAQPHVEVTEIKPEMVGATMFRAHSSEVMLEHLDHAMMMSRRPEQLVKNLKIQQSVLEATLEELEKAIVDSRSATSQLNISVNNVLREVQELPPGNPVVVDPKVLGPLPKVETRELLRDMPLEDGTMLHKIFGHKPRRASDVQRPKKDDSWYSWWRYFTELCRIIVGHPWFELLISVAIMVNSVMLGVESQMSLTRSKEDLAWSKIAEVCFLSIFTVEILLRLTARGWRVIKDGWFLFDSTLVLIAYVEQFVELFSSGGDSGYAQQVLVLRTTRLFRLIRTFRMIKQIRSIWRLVYGLFACCETIISTFMLLFIVLYVFGVMGLELITKDAELRKDPEIDALVVDSFSSIPLAMMTLVRFVTMDSISVIYAPLIKAKALVLGLYFGLLICVVSISLMNLVTAVMVEGALEHARQEKEDDAKLAKARAKQMVPEIIHLFDQIDIDGSGEVDLKEMAKFGEDGLVPDLLFEKASVDSMADLFETLDVDGSGVISRYEFIEGLLNLFLRDVPVPAQMTMKMIRQVRSDVSRLQTNVEELDKTVDVLRPFPTI
ncbi:unnamed protein product [Cladocopium goreaui]|uniref:Voltage-dependent T-type calcium channel subunit alpha-1H n=1 Tax=Cladocopium goreaui TaxID=2562237 RepID=A0A9P1GAE6_9DINO|nr:unnamed protein product [Cladocopium goreaui]|mmetsp:Transcript_65912/g.144569  ORF Transcript_65912/g.144569 Transcript_65912/m.144569 type:complete len:562 (-) Transcript_65912:284-1969(-)